MVGFILYIITVFVVNYIRFCTTGLCESGRIPIEF